MKYPILFVFLFILCSYLVYGKDPAAITIDSRLGSFGELVNDTVSNGHLPESQQDGPPQVSIIQPLNGSVFDGGQIKVDYVISGATPKSVKISVDDKPVQLLIDVKIGQNAVIVDVPGQDCKISIVAQNNFGASVPAVVNLTRNEYIFKPTLYILAIGISNYSNPDIRLQFPAKDAIDFSQSMLRQKGLLYEKVELRLLTDNKANAENIRDGLYWLQTETTSRDIAMLYMAGHGVNNNVGDFYFMPVNANIERINASCVGYAEIKGAIAAIAGKVIVFMDACHSGNILGNNQRRAAVISQAVNDLAETENGTIVFTSSTGRQFSLENPEWNNGAFTKALVEGLNGKADLFGRKVITVKNLDSYIANRVKGLTKGQQAPTTIIPTGIPDFPLAVVPDSGLLTATPHPEISKSDNLSENMPTTRQEEVEGENMGIPVDPIVENEKLASVTSVRQPLFYVALTSGISSFGSVSGDTGNGTTAFVFGADVAYFFNSWLGVGVKLNVGSCDVDFAGAGSYHDRVMFYGPALYIRKGKDKLAFTLGTGIGGLNWNISKAGIDDVSLDNGSYTSMGGFLSAGVSYMFTQYFGLGLNAQSTLGSVKDATRNERNPAGAGITLGLNFRF